MYRDPVSGWKSCLVVEQTASIGVKFSVNQSIPNLVKRTLEPLSLSKTPLIFVLVQIRVAPITQIERFLPDIQENLRHKGYPGLFKRNFRIEQTGPGGASTKEERIQWEFTNPERTRSILVDDGSLVLQTTAYDSGENFLQSLKTGLEAFDEFASPTDLQRIGLRYVDLIKPMGDCGLDDLVSPSLRPTAQLLPGKPVVHFWESLRQTSDHTRLLVRYTEAIKGFAFPQDLGPVLGLVLRQEPAQKDLFGLLDVDHFDEKAATFATDDVLDRAADLHDVIDQSFRALVTERAISLWT